jgi:hypothetical protein
LKEHHSKELTLEFSQGCNNDISPILTMLRTILSFEGYAALGWI